MVQLREPLIEALRDPQAYPHETDAIELIETHISWVFLTGPFAYKIKKPVRFPFLDFSTLDHRKRYCEDELRLNRRLASELYLDVVPIGGTRAAPKVGAKPAIEYAVKMVQFDVDRTLDRLLDDTTIPIPAIHDLAARLSRFHSELPAASGEPADQSALENAAELAESVEASERGRLEPLITWTREQSKALAFALRERERRGAIKECHGDLHLHNLAWIDDRIVPFDCLEFDRSLRCIDTLDEIAFLVMDLIAYEREDLAFELLDRYLELTGDYEGLRVFRFYLVYRALVRSKVCLLAAAQHDARNAAPWPKRYLDLADRLIEPSVPLLAITRGLSGSGKTTITNDLIGRIPAIRVRSDVERKRLHGLEPTERSAPALGRSIYSTAASDATYDVLARAADAVLAAGFNVIVDATFLERRRRQAFAALAAARGAAFMILDFEADAQELRRRVAARHEQGNDASEADLDVLEHQIEHQEPLVDGEPDATIMVDTGADVSIDDLVRRMKN